MCNPEYTTIRSIFCNEAVTNINMLIAILESITRQMLTASRGKPENACMHA